MGFLQQFHLLIKYKKGMTNKVADMLSRPPMNKISVVGTIMQLEPFTHEVDEEEYVSDVDFGEVYQQLKKKITAELEENEYHLQDRLLYKLRKLFIPQNGRIQLM